MGEMNMKGSMHPRGVLLTGVTEGDIDCIQSVFQYGAEIVCDKESGTMIVCTEGMEGDAKGATKREIAETIESATGIFIKGLKELQDKPPQKHQQRYPYGERMKTKRSCSRGKPCG